MQAVYGTKYYSILPVYSSTSMLVLKKYFLLLLAQRITQHFRQAQFQYQRKTLTEFGAAPDVAAHE